jgi:hypothetical protein
MTDNRLKEMIDRADNTPPGKVKMELLELAINEADSLGDAATGYKLRMDLIQTGVFHGYADRAIPAFAWCTKYVDSNPRKINIHDFLWKYKWIVGNITSFPQISKAKVLEMVDDFHRRIETVGYSPRPAHYMRWRALRSMNDYDGAAIEMHKWRPAVKDGLQDCSACETNSEVDLLAKTFQDEIALECAKPILTGQLKCSSVPHSTLGNVIRPLIRLNRIEEARKYAERGYRLTSNNEAHLSTIAEFLLFAVHQNQTIRALRIFTRHANWGLCTGEPSSRFDFASAAAAFLEKLAKGKFSNQPDRSEDDALPRKSRSYKSLVLSKSHPCYRPDEKYDVAELAEWYGKEAEDTARRFDQRNGNQGASQRLKEAFDLSGAG